MNETTKTVLFVAAAAVALLLAFATGPGGETFDVQELVGKQLNQFDIDSPKRLKVVKFDPETATTSDFEVAEQDGTWVIPSKQGYPADADRQMAKAVNCITDLEILRVAAESAGQHASLGVLDPSTGNLNSKAEGVGLRVVMSDGAGETLVDMIIGKPVKDANDQRYVRNTEQDIVYVVKLDPAGLSTNFNDWIEGDLLKLNPYDIRQVHIKDYSAELMVTLQGAQVQWDQRGDFSLVYNDSDSKWAPESLQRYDAATKTFVDDPLAENQELDTDALQGLRDGLDDLRIVDVERKPEGLSADLKAGSDFLKNEAAGSLATRGFAPVSLTAGAQPEILSSEGELTCTLKDGVEYVLRFGNLKIDSEEDSSGSSDAKDDASTDGKDEKKGASEGIHRYLFVTTRFNPSVLEKPVDDPLPPLPEGVESEEAAEQQEKAEAEGDKAKEGSEAKEDSKSEEKPDKKAEEGAADKDEAADEKADGKESPTDSGSELKEIIAKRKSIRAENQRRQDEYDQKIEDGNKRVQELNERFGDWYYVISNDVYKKIHLSRDQLIKEKKKDDDKAKESPAGSPLAGQTDAMPAAGQPPVKAAQEEAKAPEEKPAETPAKEEAKAPEEKPAETPAQASDETGEKNAEEAAPVSSP